MSCDNNLIVSGIPIGPLDSSQFVIQDSLGVVE